MSSTQPGNVVAQRFEIIDLAAAGGMGSVCRAHDYETKEIVALKVIKFRDATATARLLREGEALARLDHPNVVRYVAHGLTGEDEPFVAMEWIAGETLVQRMRRKPLSYAEVVDLAQGLARALAHAHDHGIVHRDVKPANLILPSGDLLAIKLVDFGVARLAAIDEITDVGTTVGTPSYMSPEQARGLRDLTPAADIFSLGCVIYRSLAGKAPFRANEPLATLAKVLFEEPVPLESIAAVDPRMAALVTRMLNKNPQARFRDGHDALSALEELADGRPTMPPPLSQRPAAIGITELSLVSAVMLGPLKGSRAPEQIAEREGISMSKLLGGARIAVLSGPGFATDKATSAVRLAHELAALDAPVVVATGRAIVGDRLPVGDAIDRAAQMLAMKRRGVSVDNVTVELLDWRWEVSAQGDTWTVVPSKEPHLRTLLGKPTTFVGRDREIATLDALWDECVAEPEARAVLLVGGPGVGKTRLLVEWLRKIQTSRSEIWTSAGDPSRTGSPYEIVAQQIRSAATLRVGEDRTLLQFKLYERAARTGDPQRVAEFLGEIVRLPFDDEASPKLAAARRDPQLMADHTLRAWLDLIEAETASGPRVLVIEDLHCGDIPSVRLLDAALRVCHRAPLFVIATARPTIDDVHPKLWAERSLHRIPVGELGRRASEALVRSVLGAETDERSVHAAVDQSAGHPLLLEEILRARIEGRPRADTVLAIVQSRLDGLTDQARRVLRAGSIFGSTFWRSGVSKLLGVDAAALLEDLERRELIVSVGARRFASEAEYVFRHALVRDAVHASLVEEDRTLGHRLAAEWLASVGEMDAAVLAEHFAQGGARENARDAWKRAAQQALDGSDFAGAIDRAERAIACGAEGSALSELRVLQIEAYLWSGSVRDVQRVSEDVLAMVAPGTSAWFRAVGAVATALSRLMVTHRIETLAEQLVAVRVEPGAEIERGIAAARMLTVIVLAGSKHRVDDIARITEEALAKYPDDPFMPSLVHFGRAMLAKRRGDVMQLVSEMDACRAAGKRSGNEKVVGVALANLADSWTHVGRYENAEACARESLAICERLGLVLYVTLAKHNLSLALARLGQLTEARRHAEEARIGFEKAHAGRLVCHSRVYMSDIARRMGDPVVAEREARAALETAETETVRATAMGVLARALLAKDDARGAFDAASEGMAILDREGALDEGDMTLRLAYFEAARACNVDVRDAAARTRERLLALAAALPTEDDRHVYLEGIEEHRHLLALT